ncbi:hypothetical protein [Chitinivorax sp. B]|uniref:hypothetical protein n=1 Tax=Chitinivorax sp. B TaxID=2502235 RepID=UPI0010FA3EF7|nr:hypothetical protein [Chitinivorax sp. B]
MGQVAVGIQLAAAGGVGEVIPPRHLPAQGIVDDRIRLPKWAAHQLSGWWLRHRSQTAQSLSTSTAAILSKR